jgi:polyferredoxin
MIIGCIVLTLFTVVFGRIFLRMDCPQTILELVLKNWILDRGAIAVRKLWQKQQWNLKKN